MASRKRELRQLDMRLAQPVNIAHQASSRSLMNDTDLKQMDLSPSPDGRGSKGGFEADCVVDKGFGTGLCGRHPKRHLRPQRP